MFSIVKKEIEWAGKKLSIETGKIARQADGAVILRSGDTIILATAVAAKKSNPETIEWKKLETDYWKNNLQQLVQKHHEETNSVVSKKIIDNFKTEIKNFYQVCPKEMLDKLVNPITNKKTNLAS